MTHVIEVADARLKFAQPSFDDSYRRSGRPAGCWETRWRLGAASPDAGCGVLVDDLYLASTISILRRLMSSKWAMVA